MTFLLLALPFAFVGFAAARWAALLLPVAVWPAYYLGLHQGWWGNGVGDGWQIALALLLVASAGATAIGVAVRKLALGTGRRPRSP